MDETMNSWIANVAGGPDSQELNGVGQIYWECMTIGWDSAPQRQRFLATLKRSPHQWRYLTAIHPNQQNDPDPRSLGWELVSIDPKICTQYGVPGYIGVYKRRWSY